MSKHHLILNKIYFSISSFQMEPIDPKNLIAHGPTERLLSSELPASSIEEEDSSNQNSSDGKSPGQRYSY